MSAKPIPEGYYSVTPYLSIKGAAEAIEFYKLAFNAVPECRRARDTFWDIPVPKMTALGDSL